MRSLRLFFISLLSAPLIAAQSGGTAQPDGMTILQKMSEQYAQAKSWHIEATEEQTNWNDYQRTWLKEVQIGAVSDKRYHFEGISQTGSALHISDGTTAWDLHPEEHAYTQKPAPVDGYKPTPQFFMNESAASFAVELAKKYAEFASRYTGATRLPDETLTIEGNSFSCYVVRVTDEQRKGPHSKSYDRDITLWIDKQTWVVRKSAMHGHTYLMISGTVQIPLETSIVTTYTVAELNGPAPESLFHFEAPPDSKLVEKFEDFHSFMPNLTGKPAPEVQVVAADGKRVPLSSYHGKPVLLDFWATWCSPCVANLPKLADLMKEAGPKGLVLLSIDEDDEAKTGNDYLAKHDFTWPNTLDDGSIGDAFSKNMIPLYVLIDASGKIVYYGQGMQENELRKAVSKLGPEFASLAPKELTQPCQTTQHQ